MLEGQGCVVVFVSVHAICSPIRLRCPSSTSAYTFQIIDLQKVQQALFNNLIKLIFMFGLDFRCVLILVPWQNACRSRCITIRCSLTHYGEVCSLNLNSVYRESEFSTHDTLSEYPHWTLFRVAIHVWCSVEEATEAEIRCNFEAMVSLPKEIYMLVLVHM